MKRIGLTLRVEEIADFGERRDCLDQRWVSLLAALRLDPIPIPNSLSDPVDWAERQNLAGLILTGGNDLSLLPEADRPAPERDGTETALLQWAATAKTPVFGVCRGLQMMNHYSGGRLVPIEAHVATRHPLRTSADDRLFAQHREVNSFHAWGIPAAVLADNLEPRAWSENWCIEAAVHRTLPWLAIMWHPERETPFAEADLSLIDNFFND